MDKDVSNHIRKLLEDGSLLAKDNDFLASVAFDFSEETILITGAAGTIGSGLTKLLLKARLKTSFYLIMQNHHFTICKKNWKRIKNQTFILF